MITQEKIKNIIAQGEVRNTNVEFKKCKNESGQSVYETICAFLNRNGGEVLMGVEDDGTITGINESAIDNHIKNILFGKEQTVLNYCPWHRTDAIYRNMSYKRFLNPLPTDPDIRYNDRDMVCVNLIESYVRLMNFIERNMPDVFALDERGINRLDLRNMLFREIVSNLLLHREFASTFSSKLLIFSDRVITENWTKPIQVGTVTLDTLETHTKNPLITKVFREMKWAEELGSGKKNIKKYAPLYYDKYEIEIKNDDKFVFSITYKNETSDVESQSENEKELNILQAGLKQPPNTNQPTNQEQILDFCFVPKNMKDIMSHLGYKNRRNFQLNYIQPLLEESLLSMTFPDNPNHQEQKYITTEKGKAILNKK